MFSLLKSQKGQRSTSTPRHSTHSQRHFWVLHPTQRQPLSHHRKLRDRDSTLRTQQGDLAMRRSAMLTRRTSSATTNYATETRHRHIVKNTLLTRRLGNYDVKRIGFEKRTACGYSHDTAFFQGNAEKNNHGQRTSALHSRGQFLLVPRDGDQKKLRK